MAVGHLVSFVGGQFARQSDHNQPIDSLLKDFLEEIRERRPKEEHAMGSGYDGIDMLDVQRT